MIQAIYTRQKAKIRINGDVTRETEIEKGTKQGCPPSPLLFILSLEILNKLVRKDGNTRGSKVRGEKYEIQAFADDLEFISVYLFQYKDEIPT